MSCKTIFPIFSCYMVPCDMLLLHFFCLLRNPSIYTRESSFQFIDIEKNSGNQFSWGKALEFFHILRLISRK